MTKTVVTICTAGPNQFYWRAVAQNLGNEPDLVVDEVRDLSVLANRVKEAGTRVLMLEMSPSDFTEVCSRYRDVNPELAIIGIDPTGVDTVISLRDAGLELIAGIIRSVKPDKAIPVGAESTQRYIGSTELRNLALTCQPGNSENVTPVDSTAWSSLHTDDEPALRWIEICLQQQLLREDTTERRLQLQNLPINAAGLRGLLDPRDANLSEDELRSRRQIIESLLTEQSFEPDSLTARFEKVCQSFGLHTQDRYLLLLTLAPELDGRFARVFGFLNDDFMRKRPTPTIAGRVLLPDAPCAANVITRLVSGTVLSHLELVTLDASDHTPDAEQELLPAPDILTYLLSSLPHDICQGVRLITPNTNVIDSQSIHELKERLVAWCLLAARDNGTPPAIQLNGDKATLMWMQRGLAAAGRKLVILDVEANSDPTHARAAAISAARISAVQHAIVLVAFHSENATQISDGLFNTTLKILRERVSLLMVYGKTATDIGHVWTIQRDPPGIAQRVHIWKDSATALGVSLPDEHADAVARICRFAEPDIEATLNHCGPDCEDLDRLKAAIRHVSRSSLPSAVRRVEATYGWHDIELAPKALQPLRQISVHVTRAREVLDDWGFRKRMPYGHGVAALFSGPSGTGKTMAAQIIAHDLGVELLKVDLSQTVSKYIGQTEKNLNEVFNAAERASAVLLFDEADALFGKRSDVKDAHDRYANIEVAYLLQRMEEYGGLAILTTNFRQNLDNAFLRRLRFVVDFDCPDARLREKIWKLAFPASAPLANDVSLDFLARRLELTGGNIQKIALCAAFAAVADSGIITNQHIVDATREELSKLGITDAEKKLAGMAA